MYHVSVLSLVPIATDVDLLESSPQQIVCSVVASQTMFVASEMPPDLVSVRKASVQTEDVRQKQVGLKTHMPAFFALSRRFVFRTC